MRPLPPFSVPQFPQLWDAAEARETRDSQGKAGPEDALPL